MHVLTSMYYSHYLKYHAEPQILWRGGEGHLLCNEWHE